jgi:hypothetical protein
MRRQELCNFCGTKLARVNFKEVPAYVIDVLYDAYCPRWCGPQTRENEIQFNFSPDRMKWDWSDDIITIPTATFDWQHARWVEPGTFQVISVHHDMRIDMHLDLGVSEMRVRRLTLSEPVGAGISEAMHG